MVPNSHHGPLGPSLLGASPFLVPTSATFAYEQESKLQNLPTFSVHPGHFGSLYIWSRFRGYRSLQWILSA